MSVLVGHPQASILSSEKHQEALIELEPPEAPSAPCVVTEMIRYQAQVNPSADAVQVEHQHPVNYRTLWQLVETLVSSQKFQANTIVPVCMDPSVEFVATVLAILHAGAAYVLIDPESSAERNQLIVADSGAGFVVVHQQYSRLFQRSETF
jgi:acyl-CoA synthetase (AMP-forming)/AMP-acid ligase II